MSVRGFRFACIVVALLLASFAAGAVPAASAPARPTLVIKTLGGKTFDLAAHRGQWVIVNFWATWCSPCIAEMPAISKFVASHKKVTAIGLAYQPEPLDVVLKFAHEHPVDYPLARLDMQHPPAGLTMPVGLPTTDLIAPDGHLAKRFIGPVNATLLGDAIAAASKSH
ncbi:MAG: TlpA family protein disulfide reductase [Rhodanobacteraceae bacterium]|nr:MAG: TlpA family protein disulfide reductase [Rhodanobacteraceae bacterium]